MEVKLKIKYKNRYFSILNYNGKELVLEDTGSLSSKLKEVYMEVDKKYIEKYLEMSKKLLIFV